MTPSHGPTTPPPVPSWRPDRRRLLAAGAAGAAAATLTGTSAHPDAAAAPDEGPFRHGVASGDPLPAAVVLWTRVTPTPEAEPGSGRGPHATVEWVVATDPRLRDVVRRGSTRTGPAVDHTVKIDVTGLAPARTYYYRFRYQGRWSRLGRTRTAPAPDAPLTRLRLGVVSCANLQAGYFGAYRHLAARDDLDAVLHLGDYLYEYAPGEYGAGPQNRDIRRHRPAREIVGLADYRQRHAQYKRDPDLQQLHARFPFVLTWDDHETANDAWRDGAENHDAGEGDWHQRRARGHRAYDEWMPVRLAGTALPGDGTRLFRRLQFGQLASLSMLDLRSHRDQQVTQPAGSEVSDPERTITGRTQMAWLRDSLSQQQGQWTLIGNPVMIAPVTFAGLPHDLIDPVNDVTGLLPRDGQPYNTDQWDGYTDDRREIFSHIRDRGIRDTLFVTGDIHSAWACELPYDPNNPLSGSAGAEFVCTSVTSNNLDDITGSPPRTTSLAVETAIRANNPHVKHLNFDDHGFSVLEVTSTHAQMDWYSLADRTDPDTGTTHAASYETRAGTGRVQRVDDPLEELT